jgi:hypothetical protein
VSGGGSGSAAFKELKFKTGITTNAPAAGDSVLTHNELEDAQVRVFVEGELRYDSSTIDGYEHDAAAGTITFHPPLLEGERVHVEILDAGTRTTYALQAAGGGGSYDTDAQAYFTAEGITSTGDKDAIDALIVGLKADGVWTKIKVLHLGYGTGLVNAKSPGTLDATAPNGVTINASGYTFNGTNQYLNTGLNPNTHLTNATEWHAFYVKSSTDDKAVSGAHDGSSSSYFFPRSSGNISFRISGASDLNGGANASAAGTYVFRVRETGVNENTRGTKNGTQFYSNAVASGTSDTPNETIYIGAFSNAGTPVSHNASTLGIYIIGGGASGDATDADMANIYTRINTFITATSRN